MSVAITANEEHRIIQTKVRWLAGGMAGGLVRRVATLGRNVGSALGLRLGLALGILVGNFAPGWVLGRGRVIPLGGLFTGRLVSTGAGQFSVPLRLFIILPCWQSIVFIILKSSRSGVCTPPGWAAAAGAGSARGGAPAQATLRRRNPRQTATTVLNRTRRRRRSVERKFEVMVKLKSRHASARGMQHLHLS